ncbi:DNA polymerase/3'-5' exonuclease PolX [Robertmurraya siralis]|uniref:DNA polymerase beta n=1 Tax=Robertmurraya siralis TaxID=77777 RepID=A0A919WEA4_9BACI|nr:DNA polymerase/3'-5' exonuclease PolX [Robertmurraya siralis]GIN60218.1 DNA polymerase/3'-5' exonuclease PolX [Robertmurraya siralis]
MTVSKKDVIRLLETIAVYMELKGENPFKVSAFRKAAAALEVEEQTIDEIEDFTKLQGIGKGTASVIEEFLQTGQSVVLKELQEQVPNGLVLLLQLPGLGGKKIAKLHKELGIENVDDLRKACLEKKVRVLAGFGQKTEEKILAAIASVGNQPDRLPLAYMLPIAQHLEEELEKMHDVERFSRAGSIRRVRETVKDLDFIISTAKPSAVKEQLLKFENIKEIVSAGETKVSLILDYSYDVSVDFRLVKPEEFATTLHHFTGSKAHNVRMRQLAKERGEKISEYGVEVAETGEILTFKSEADFYQHFNLPLIPPEMREDGKEIENYSEELNIISIEDIQGDLHMHSTWSDGAHSIEQMINECRKLGYKYMAITDHSKFLKVANGLDEERLRRQREEIAKLNEKYDDITILAGVEMDILPDGSLDFEDDFLEEMDLVIASIHSGFSQTKEQIMKRLINALNNQHVDIIAHPTGRKIGIREGYSVDIDFLVELAKETNTALELNANPNRLDLSAEHIKKAQEAGVKVVINTDAHRMETLEHMSIGVSTAKKGWIKRSNVLNALSLDELLQFLHER